MKKLGNNIKWQRKAKKLSQEKLAEKLNFTGNYIWMIERGDINIPVDTLYNIAKILDIDVVELFKF